jgi:hypothetical protein
MVIRDPQLHQAVTESGDAVSLMWFAMVVFS